MNQNINTKTYAMMNNGNATIGIKINNDTDTLDLQPWLTLMLDTSDYYKTLPINQMTFNLKKLPAKVVLNTISGNSQGKQFDIYNVEGLLLFNQ
jgi:hypothetical protein